MIRADFYQKNGKFREFIITGHAGLAESGKDVACAAVSSAVQLSVNLMESLGCSPKAEAADNIITCKADEKADVVIKELLRHLKAIREEFPQTIKITIRRCKYV